MSKTVLFVLLSGLLAEGCAGVYYTRPGWLAPATATISPADRSALLQRAIPVLLDEGYVPQVVNDAAGYISARRREDLADDALLGTQVTLVVTPNGVVRLEVTGSGYFHSEEDFQAAMSARQKRLVDRIVAAPAG